MRTTATPMYDGSRANRQRAWWLDKPDSLKKNGKEKERRYMWHKKCVLLTTAIEIYSPFWVIVVATSSLSRIFPPSGRVGDLWLTLWFFFLYRWKAFMASLPFRGRVLFFILPLPFFSSPTGSRNKRSHPEVPYWRARARPHALIFCRKAYSCL